MTGSRTIIHVSDLHFHRLPRRPGEWGAKRALGALNLLAGRARRHPLARVRALVARLDAMAWDHLVLTGDLGQLGTAGEFDLAGEVLAPLLERGPERVTIVPGNHDRYVQDGRAAAAWARHFGPFFGSGGIAAKPLGGDWWLAGWNSAAPRPLFDASGCVGAETLAATERWMAELPPGARVIVANHYPVRFPPGERAARGHALTDADSVLDWLIGHGVRLYLHGHVHRNWVLTLPRPGGGAPLTLINSAASAARPRGGQSSSFHRVRLAGDAVEVDPLMLE